MNEKKYKSVVVIWGVILLTLQALALIDVVGLRPRSEERRVGKECRSRWSPYH